MIGKRNQAKTRTACQSTFLAWPSAGVLAASNNPKDGKQKT